MNTPHHPGPARSRATRPTAMPTRSRRGDILAGCLIVVAIVVVLVGIGIFYAVRNFSNIGLEFASRGVIEIIRVEDVPTDEREDMIAVVRGIPKDSDVSLEQLGMVFEESVEGDAFAVAELRVLADNRVATSGLDDAQKQVLTTALRGIAAAIADERLVNEQIQSSLAPIRTTEARESSDGVSISVEVLKPDITDEELTTLLESLTVAAPAAASDEQAAWPDPSDLLRQRLESALGVTITPEVESPDAGSDSEPGSDAPGEPAPDADSSSADSQSG